MAISSIPAWASRRAGGLAMIALLTLTYWVISSELEIQRYSFQYQQQDSPTVPTYQPKPSAICVKLFAYYCLFIHVLVAVFPVRSCWAIWDITRSLKKVARSKTLQNVKFPSSRRGSSASLSSAETLTLALDSSASSSSSEAGGAEYFTDAANPVDSVVHAIIVPNYKEEVDTLRETLEVLASHPQARDTYDVYLGMEQREKNGELKALSLISEFIKKFRSIDFTLHPSDIPGETAGKGSNCAWAARRMSERYSLHTRKNVIVTSIDADSHLSSNYFALITSMHLKFSDTANTTLYAAPIIFDRNADKVPAIVRVADILWCAAGMSGLYSGSTTAPPTSVYSLPLELVDRVGGWDCDNESIGEDLHMYIKCFFALNGNLICRTILSPVSQTNVTGGGHGKGYKGALADIQARYRQAMRHMWGALDTGYALRKAVELWKERKHTSRAFQPLHTSVDTDSDIYVPETQLDTTNSEAVPESGIFSDVTQDTLKAPNYMRILYLFHRLFEAHFLPVHMTILIFASTAYMFVAGHSGDRYGIAWIFFTCSILRTLGFMQVACYLFLYEDFHKTCLAAREQEILDAGLAKGMHFSHRAARQNFVDYVMVPLVAPLFGSIPCAQAQLSHFFTLDLVYTVSKKVTRHRATSLQSEAMV
ncbi:glycosyl transferase family group 2-domain-containing protein [Coniochaeta sp. 2T2.1]|nr:glycosyl transferase family group 2-domain-containing protein [Coniochaeta sp. 2T2.1]